MRVCVLAGGGGSERAVSIASGVAVANALLRRGVAVALCDVGAPPPRGNAFVRKPYAESMFAANAVCLWHADVTAIAAAANATIPVLHGGIGEDGTAQMLLTAAGVKFCGSGAAACRLSMDKARTKTVLAAAGIATAPSIVHRRGDVLALAQCEREVGYPCVVKPNDGGSSVGVAVCGTRRALSAAVAAAEAFTDTVLVERYVAGRECSVAVLGETVLPPVAILPPADGFYDYKHKYLAQTQLLCPANFPPEETARLTDAARRAFVALGLSDYGRIDFLLTDDGTPVCLEANALPGMTSHSLFPLAARAAGISYDALCMQLVAAARVRQ